jgi:hypothetical protein
MIIIVTLVIFAIALLRVATAQIGPSGTGQNMGSTSAIGPRSTTPIGPGTNLNSKTVFTPGGGGGGTCNGTVDLSSGCAQPMLGGF